MSSKQKDKRIRLTLDECKIIRVALRNLDVIPNTKDALERYDPERLKQMILNNFMMLPDGEGMTGKLMQLSSRFAALSDNDGYYARRWRA